MRCSTVQISGSGISQLDGERVALSVAKEEIRRIELAYDPRVRRPFVRFFAGFVLLATGLILIIAAFLVAEGGVYRVTLKSLDFGFGIPLLPLLFWTMVGAGSWLIISVLFRGRYTFVVSTAEGTRKFFFDEAADVREIRSFIERANAELGYRIDASLMQSMHF